MVYVCVPETETERQRDGETSAPMSLCASQAAPAWAGDHLKPGEFGYWLQWNCHPPTLPAGSGSTGGDGILDTISSVQREFFSLGERWIYGPDLQDSKV